MAERPPPFKGTALPQFPASQGAIQMVTKAMINIHERPPRRCIRTCQIVILVHLLFIITSPIFPAFVSNSLDLVRNQIHWAPTFTVIVRALSAFLSL